MPSPYPYLARGRLLVLSSLREGLGNVVVEALAVGTPVVATDCSAGLRALFGERGLGPLVPVGDVAALARAIDQGLRRDRIARPSWPPPSPTASCRRPRPTWTSSAAWGPPGGTA